MKYKLKSFKDMGKQLTFIDKKSQIYTWNDELKVMDQSLKDLDKNNRLNLAIYNKLQHNRSN